MDNNDTTGFQNDIHKMFGVTGRGVQQQAGQEVSEQDLQAAWENLLNAVREGCKRLAMGYMPPWEPDVSAWNRPLGEEAIIAEGKYVFNVLPEGPLDVIKDAVSQGENSPILKSVSRVAAETILDAQVLSDLSNIITNPAHLENKKLPEFLQAISANLSKVYHLLRPTTEWAGLLQNKLQIGLQKYAYRPIRQYYKDDVWGKKFRGKMIQELDCKDPSKYWPDKLVMPDVRDNNGNDNKYKLFFIAHAKEGKQKEVAKLFGIKLQEKQAVGAPSAGGGDVIQNRPKTEDDSSQNSSQSDKGGENPEVQQDNGGVVHGLTLEQYTWREHVPTAYIKQKEDWWKSFAEELETYLTKLAVDPKRPTFCNNELRLDANKSDLERCYIDEDGELKILPSKEDFAYDVGSTQKPKSGLFLFTPESLKLPNQLGQDLCHDLGLQWRNYKKNTLWEWMGKVREMAKTHVEMPKVRKKRYFSWPWEDSVRDQLKQRRLGEYFNDTVFQGKTFAELTHGDSDNWRFNLLSHAKNWDAKEALAKLLKYKGPLPLPPIPLIGPGGENDTQPQTNMQPPAASVPPQPQTNMQPPAGDQTNNPPGNQPPSDQTQENTPPIVQGQPPAANPPGAQPPIVQQPQIVQGPPPAAAPAPQQNSEQIRKNWWNAFRKEAFQKYNLMLLKKTKKCSNRVLKHNWYPTRHDLIIGGELYRGYGKDDEKYYAYNQNDTDNPLEAWNDPVTVGEVFTERLGKDLCKQLRLKLLACPNYRGSPEFMGYPYWENLKTWQFGKYMQWIYKFIHRLPANELPSLEKFKLSDKEYDSRQKKIDKHYLKSYIDEDKWVWVTGKTLKKHNGGNRDLTKDTWKKSLIRYAEPEKQSKLAKMLGVKEIPASKNDCGLRWKWWNNFRDEIFLEFNEKLIEVGGPPFEPLSKDQHPSDDMLLAGGSCFRGFDRKSCAYTLSSDELQNLMYVRGDYNNTEVKINQIVSDHLGRKLYEKLKKLDEEYNGKTHSSWGGIVSELSMKDYIGLIYDMVVKRIPDVQLPTKIFLSKAERDKRWKKVKERFLNQFPIGLRWKEMKTSNMTFSNKTVWQNNLWENANKDKQTLTKLKELLDEKPKKKATTLKTCKAGYTLCDVFNGVSKAITQLFPSIFSLKTLRPDKYREI